MPPSLFETSPTQAASLRDVIDIDLDLSAHPDPFPALIACLQEHCDGTGDLSGLTWLLPRVEQAGALRQALSAHAGRAAEAAGPLRFAVSPVIQTVDRLSDHASSMLWLELRMAAHQALGTVPELTAQARSPSQRWALADEYLSLAHACVANSGQGAVQGLVDANPLAGPEARIVLALASEFHDSLMALQADAPTHPAWQRTTGIVWLDDGDPAATSWLRRHACGRVVYRVSLVSLQQEPQAVLPDAADRDLTLLQAPQADAVAHMAAARILAWLEQGTQSTQEPIGVAVVDRLLARRVRSLLEAAGVQVDDRTGWRLSTTRLAGWLDSLLRGWLHADWALWLSALQPQRMDLMQGGLAAQLRARWATRLSTRALDADWEALRADALMLAGTAVAATGANLADQANAPHAGQAAGDALHRLLAAFETFGRHDRPLCRWAGDTLDLMAALGATAGVQADSAGQTLLGLLRGLARSRLDTGCDGSFFLLVLGSQLEAARFRPQDASSPVRFMPLQSFRLQRFGRMLVLGVARRHFMPSPPGLLPPSVAAELGLSDPWLQRAQSLWALAEIVQQTPDCALVHQSQAAGQPDPLLGWLRALGLHRQAAGLPDWHRAPQTVTRQANRAQPVALEVGGLPAPESLPVKALAELSICPLKFVLGELASLRDLQPGVPDDRAALLRGLWIHDILERLWRDLGTPADAGNPLQWLQKLEQALAVAWRRLQPPLRSRLYEDRLEFERNLPRIAALLARRHEQGWQVLLQEEPLRAPLAFHPDHKPVTVHGRMDRLERNGDASAIVDVKTGSVSTLRARAGQWLDYPQLPLYAWMLGTACQALEYLALKGDKPAYIPLKGATPQEMAEQVRESLSQAMVQLFVNAEPAQPRPGDECQHCDHAGTCRTSWWQKETS